MVGVSIITRMSKDAGNTILKSVIFQVMFWHGYPKQNYNELTRDRYYVELQEEHSDLFD